MGERAKKVKAPTSRQYGQAEIDLALSWCPDIYPCAKCKWPVIDGYCCTTCGDNNPSEKAHEAA